MTVKRPFGITLIAISVAFTASFTFITGLEILNIVPIIIFGYGLPLTGIMATTLGVIAVLWGTYGILRAERLWHMEKNAWRWTTLWVILDLVISFLSSAYLILVISFLTMIYLFTKRNSFS